MSQRYVYISVCFWIIPWQFQERKRVRAASGEAGWISLSKKQSQNLPQTWLCVPKNSCEVWAAAFWMSLWKLWGRKAEHIGRWFFFIPAYTMLLQSASLYMYIQAMFTEKYLHWCRLTFSQLSLLGMAWHTDSDISHIKCFWSIILWGSLGPEYVEWF